MRRFAVVIAVSAAAACAFGIDGNHTYTKANNGRWVTGTLSAKARASDDRAANPYVSLASNAFASTGTKTLTVAVTLDSGGRPVEITATGCSANNVFTATETFSHYNKPVTITAP